MPFIEPHRREEVETTGKWEQPGDLCFLHYLPTIRRWHNNRRWTEAHNITKDVFGISDDQAAKLLAWIVFIGQEVLPYEVEKRKENGEIK